MTKYPISVNLQKAYRDTLVIADAPSFIDTDTPVTPVAIIANSTSASNSQAVIQSDGTNLISSVNQVNTQSYPIGNSSQTAVQGYAAITTNTTTTLRTVTTGKTFYLTGIQLTHASGDSGGNIALRNDSTQFANFTFRGIAGGVDGQLFMPFYPPVKILSAKVFDGVTTAVSTGININFTGWEE